MSRRKKSPFPDQGPYRELRSADELLKNPDHHTSALYQTARAQPPLALTAATEARAPFDAPPLNRTIAATPAATLQHADSTGEARILRAFL